MDAFSIFKWARHQPGLTHSQHALVLILATYADKDNICWPGISTLASHLGMPDTHIRRLLRELSSFNLVAVEGRGIKRKITLKTDGIGPKKKTRKSRQIDGIGLSNRPNQSGNETKSVYITTNELPMNPRDVAREASANVVSSFDHQKDPTTDSEKDHQSGTQSANRNSPSFASRSVISDSLDEKADSKAANAAAHQTAMNIIRSILQPEEKQNAK